MIFLLGGTCLSPKPAKISQHQATDTSVNFSVLRFPVQRLFTEKKEAVGSSQERFLCVPPSSPSPPLSWCEMTVQKAGTAKMQQETWVTRVPTQQCSQNSSVPNCARKCHLFLRLKPPKPSACVGFSLALARHWLKHVGDSKSLLASCTSLLSYIEYRDFYLTQRIWNCHCE